MSYWNDITVFGIASGMELKNNLIANPSTKKILIAKIRSYDDEAGDYDKEVT